MEEYTIVDVVATDDSEPASESWAQPCLPGNGLDQDVEPASGEARSPNRRWSRAPSVRTPVLTHHVHDEQPSKKKTKADEVATAIEADEVATEIDADWSALSNPGARMSLHQSQNQRPPYLQPTSGRAPWQRQHQQQPVTGGCGGGGGSGGGGGGDGSGGSGGEDFPSSGEDSDDSGVADAADAAAAEAIVPTIIDTKI